MKKERKIEYSTYAHIIGLIMTLSLAYYSFAPRPAPLLSAPSAVSADGLEYGREPGAAVAAWFKKGPVSLALDFKGLIENENQRVVLVSQNGHEAHSFKLGQTRPPGLTLESIENDQAIFSFEDQRISVPLSVQKPMAKAGLITILD